MRYLLTVVVSSLFLVLSSGCYLAPVMPPSGLLFSSVEAPIDTDMDKTRDFSKMGEASTMSILGLVGVGDASISSAAYNGGLTEINHADYHYMNVLLVYQSFTTKVYGE